MIRITSFWHGGSSVIKVGKAGKPSPKFDSLKYISPGNISFIMIPKREEKGEDFIKIYEPILAMVVSVNAISDMEKIKERSNKSLKRSDPLNALYEEMLRVARWHSRNEEPGNPLLIDEMSLKYIGTIEAGCNIVLPGLDMRSFLEISGISKEILKTIDDRNYEFKLAMEDYGRRIIRGGFIAAGIFMIQGL
ncbi:MAG: hypothetical protein ABIJ26_02255 [Candidatus Margulisiibacteriota bacterium]|nr:hypothetical protein [Candidatus Margulisiibacteriota bacterium]